MNSIERTWRMFLKDALIHGEWVTKDDGDEILELIDNHCFIANVADEVFPNSQVFNLDLFKKLVGDGKFNINGYPIKNNGLLRYVEELEDPEQICLDGDDAFVYSYPERLFNVTQANRDGSVVSENQVETIINRLKEHSGSNRAVANLYMCGLDKNEQHIPCLQVVQCLIRDNQLSLHIYFRSNDLFSAYCSNMLFIQYLGLKIVEELKETYPSLKFHGTYYNSSSLHIYKGDYEQAKRVVHDV